MKLVRIQKRVVKVYFDVENRGFEAITSSYVLLSKQTSQRYLSALRENDCLLFCCVQDTTLANITLDMTRSLPQLE